MPIVRPLRVAVHVRPQSPGNTDWRVRQALRQARLQLDQNKLLRVLAGTDTVRGRWERRRVEPLPRGGNMGKIENCYQALAIRRKRQRVIQLGDNRSAIALYLKPPAAKNRPKVSSTSNSTHYRIIWKQHLARTVPGCYSRWSLRVCRFCPGIHNGGINIMLPVTDVEKPHLHCIRSEQLELLASRVSQSKLPGAIFSRYKERHSFRVCQPAPMANDSIFPTERIFRLLGGT